MTWDDVDFEENRIRIYTRKTKDGSWEEAWLPMTDDLKSSLATHRQKGTNEKWVFTDLDSVRPALKALPGLKQKNHQTTTKTP